MSALGVLPADWSPSSSRAWCSNPLMVREVSYVFWIALGLAVGQSARLQASRDVSEEVMSESAAPRSRVSGLRRPMTVLLGGLLVLTIPSRAKSELAGANLTRVSYGFFDWGMDGRWHASSLVRPPGHGLH